ncbi:MAG: helix-turn-helix domain-containing protein [Candidatus Magasanikbacteria bacterium]|jgi:hypothetical protein
MNFEGNIINIVCENYGVNKEAVFAQDRQQNIAEVRMVLAYCLRLVENLSFPAIGKIIGNRDHTTMMHSCSRIAKKIEQDKKFAVRIKLIIDKILANRYNEVAKPKVNPIEINIGEDEEESEPEPDLNYYVVPYENEKLELSDRERGILIRYRNGETLRKIGQTEKVTTQRISQIIIKAVTKEVKAKIREGFDIDIEESIKGEKIAHNFNLSKKISDEDVRKLTPEFILRVGSGTQIKALAKEVGLSVSKFNKFFPEVLEEADNKKRREKQRWTKYYISCRGCGTTKIPHVKKGYCEQCLGVFRGKRRDSVLKNKNKCEVCSIERGKAIQKYKKDFYITKDGRVLCRNCFLQLTGDKLASSRWK